MKSLKTFLLVTLIFLSGITLWGQKTIVCDLQVEILPYYPIKDATIKSMYSNICKITQSFQIRSEKKDTLYFVIDNPSQFSFFNAFYFQKLYIKERNTNDTIPHIFAFDTLKVILPKKDCNIEIHYYYQPDYFMFGNEYVACLFCPYQQSWFSWYFSLPNMKINDVIISVHEQIYFFANLMRKKTDKGKIYLSTESIPENGISFFWIEKPYYEYIKTSIRSQQYNLYLLKGFTFTDDSASCYTLMPPLQKVDSSVINTYISDLNKAVEGLVKIFQKNVSFDIVEALLDISQGEDRIRWGSAFPLSDSNVFIFMDTSFWSGHNCLHEIVHAYNDILPAKSDSSYYFFHESMTEYLSIYFKYNREKRDAVYEAKILKYINLKQDYISIFEINKSEVSLDFGGTYGVTYLKTPYVINSFAKRIGEDKFIEILSLFYKQIRKTKTVNFLEFEKIFKSNGVSDEDWAWLMKNL
jgi:hypothetical protein